MNKLYFLAKKAINKTQFISLMVVFAAIPAFAATSGDLNLTAANQANQEKVKGLISAESVKLEDFKVEDTGLLSTNPFYFIKNWRRSTQKALVFTTVRKTELELNTLNEKAAELKSLQNINLLEDSDKLIKALNVYIESLGVVQAYFNSLKDSKDQSLDKLIDQFISQSFKHIKLFEELRYSTDILGREKLNQVEKLLSQTAQSVLVNDNFDQAKTHLSQALSKQGGGLLKDLRLVEAVDLLEEEISFESDARAALQSIKQDLLLELEGTILVNNLNEVITSVLGQMPGDLWRRVKIIDELREYGVNPDLRNNLTLARQLILDSANKTREIGKSEAQRLSNEIEDLVAFLKSKNLDAKNKKLPLNILISRTEFNLKQANDSIKNSQYIQAFGQLSLAAASVNNAFLQMTYKSHAEKEVIRLKASYDKIFNLVNENELATTTSPKLFNYLKSAEANLARTSDLVSINKNIDVIIAVIKDAKIALSQASGELRNIILKLQSEQDSQKNSESFLQKVLGK